MMTMMKLQWSVCHFHFKLCVISVVMKLDSLATDDMVKGEHVYWDTAGDSVCPGLCTSKGNVLCSVGEVRLKPLQGSVSECNGVM